MGDFGLKGLAVILLILLAVGVAIVGFYSVLLVKDGGEVSETTSLMLTNDTHSRATNDTFQWQLNHTGAIANPTTFCQIMNSTNVSLAKQQNAWANVTYTLYANVSLAEGRQNYFAQCYNSTGFMENSTNISILFDRTSPIIQTLDNPANNSFQSSANVLFQINVSDNLETLAGYIVCNLTVWGGGTNQTNVSITPNATSNVTINSMPQGNQTGQWSCADRAGNNATLSSIINFTVDTVPVQNASFSGSTPLNESGNSSAVNWTINSTISFEPNLDRCNLVWFNGTANTYRGVKQDANTSCSWIVNHTSEMNSNFSYYFWFNDTAGNVANYSNITRFASQDNTAPTGAGIVSATNNSNATVNPSITANCTDNLLTNQNLTLYIDNSVNQTVKVNNNTNYQFNLTNLASGNKTFGVRCTDWAGNNLGSASNFTFNIISILPTAPTINAPTNGTNSTVSNVNVSVSFTVDSGAQVSQCLLDVRNQTSTWGNVSMVVTQGANPSCKTQYNFTKEGQFQFRVYVNDTANNVNVSGTINYTYDANPPEAVNILSPANRSNLSGTSFTLEYNVTDNATISSMTCIPYIDSSAKTTQYVNNNTNTTQTISGLSDGNHTINVTCTDSVGLMQNSTIRTILTDSNAPSILLVSSPANNSVIGGNNWTVNWTPSDNIATTNIECDVVNNGTIVSNVTYNTSQNIAVQVNITTNGTYAWHIDCFDHTRINNKTTGNYTVISDTIAPVPSALAFRSLANGTSTLPSMAITFDWNASDIESQIDTCFVRILNSTNTTIHNITGVVNASGNTVNCTLKINASDIQPSGGVYFQGGVINKALLVNYTSSNLTNYTVTKLISGWNLIMANANMTARDFANMSKNITSVAIWNGTASTKDFNTTYTVGTATNENWTLSEGMGVYVRTNTNVTLIRLTIKPSNVNTTLTNLGLGWNIAGSFSWTGQNMLGLCGNSTSQLTNISANATYFSYHDTTNGIYYPHKCGFSPNENITIPRGSAYWIRVNGTTSYIRVD